MDIGEYFERREKRDIGEYFERNTRSTKKSSEPERKCLECGKPLERSHHYLYFQHFCSEDCKQKYVSGVKAFEQRLY